LFGVWCQDFGLGVEILRGAVASLEKIARQSLFLPGVNPFAWESTVGGNLKLGAERVL
jgi:hypothetical protein